MTYRVIQWATGLVGQEAILGVLAHPELELVGTWVHSPDKVGRDVGEICGIDPIGVTAVGTLDEICAIDADAVVYAPVLASTRDVIALLESGKNVVTPVGWIYPDHNASGVAGARGRVRRRPASRCTAPASTRAASPSASRSRCRRCAATSATCAPRSSPTSATTRPRWSCARSCCSARIPRDADDEPDAEGARTRVHAVDRHDRGRARLRARSRASAHATRWRSRRKALDTPVGVHRGRHGRRAALHVGRRPSTASP